MLYVFQPSLSLGHLVNVVFEISIAITDLMRFINVCLEIIAQITIFYSWPINKLSYSSLEQWYFWVVAEYDLYLLVRTLNKFEVNNLPELMPAPVVLRLYKFMIFYQPTLLLIFCVILSSLLMISCIQTFPTLLWHLFTVSLFFINNLKQP